jgi:uncharacterized repeat protein (TIGR03833 family)
MDGTRRADIRPGLRVGVVQKQDQRTGRLTEGIVKDLLTNSPVHPHGIKVRLESGSVGRIKKVMP